MSLSFLRDRSVEMNINIQYKYNLCRIAHVGQNFGVLAGVRAGSVACGSIDFLFFPPTVYHVHQMSTQMGKKTAGDKK